MVTPGRAGSAEVGEPPDPTPGEDELLVRGLAVGVCGTDKEIVDGDYGWAPKGSERLVLGHESLGRVEQAPPGSDFAEGDLVAARYSWRGTHKGEAFLGIPPSGKAILVRGMDFFRLRDGKIVEHWDNVDELGMLTQLGDLG